MRQMSTAAQTFRKLAFKGNAEIINASKMAILLAFLTSGVLGLMWLRFVGIKLAAEVTGT